MGSEDRNFYEFGSHRLDPTKKLLLRSGEPIVLTLKAFETLLVLVQRSEQVVSKDELMKLVWPGTFVEEANLTQHISMVRRALGETPRDHRYIVTFAGRGYCFAEKVRIVSQDSDDRVLEASTQSEIVAEGDAEASTKAPEANSSNLGQTFGDQENANVPNLSTGQASGRSHAFWNRSGAVALTVGVALVVIAMSALRVYRPAGVRDQPLVVGLAQKRVMLPVLPFQNLSGDTRQEYFSDGLTEEVITDLGELSPDQLGIIARTSSSSFKHTDKTITQIGRELEVDYVLEGSVRREGGATRISAQLIRVRDQVHVWAHNYERESGGLIALQDELGSAIAQQVQVRLASPIEGRIANRRPPDPQAYELYLKGRFLLNKQTNPELGESTKIFQRSIEQDPSFALAYAGLAKSYISRSIGSEQEFDPKAKAAASRALELDDSIAEAHTVMGTVKADFEYDWPGAEREFRHALELNPNYADTHYRYAWHYLTPRGESARAIAEMKTALELDPFSRIDNTILGLAFFYARRYDESLEQFQKAVQLNPDFFVTYYHLAWLHSQLGQYPEAIAALTRGRALAGDDRVKTAAADDAALKKAYAAEGARGFWNEILREEDKDDPEIGEFGTAQVYARLGDKENALRWLEHNYDVRLPLGTLVEVDPAFDALRSEPRFIGLVQRMGLAATTSTSPKASSVQVQGLHRVFETQIPCGNDKERKCAAFPSS